MNEPVNISSYLGLVTGEASKNPVAPVTGNSEFAMMLSKYIGAGTSVLSGEGNTESESADIPDAQVLGERISQSGTSPPIPIDEFPLRNLQGLDEEVIIPITLTGPQVPATAVLPTVQNATNDTLPQTNSGLNVGLGANTGNPAFPFFAVGSQINQSSSLQALAQTEHLSVGGNVSSTIIGQSPVGPGLSSDLNSSQTGHILKGGQDVQLPINQELLMERNNEITSSATRLTVVKEATGSLNSGNAVQEKTIEPNFANMINARPASVYSSESGPNQPVVRVYGSQTEPAAQPKLFNLTDKLVDQVVQRLSLVKLNERSEIRINLQPETLGDLKIKVSFENGILSAKLMTASYAVKESLETGLNQLRQNLNAQGFDVQNLSVSVNDNRHSEHGHMHGRQNRFLKEQDDNLDIFNMSEADDVLEHEYAVNWLV